jgi:hypothetical protein
MNTDERRMNTVRQGRLHYPAAGGLGDAPRGAILMLYLDTSVLVAYYLPEPRNAAVQRLFSGPERIAVSRLSEVEFYAAISRRVRANELAREDALQVLSRFRVHADEALYRMIPVEQRDYALAREWLATFHTPLRTLDAIHLAVSFSNRLMVVTADQVPAESAGHFGVKHRVIS